MARQHKAPTQVTLVKEEKSAFALWVESNWRMGMILAGVVTAAILASQFLRQKSAQEVSDRWEALRQLTLTEDPARIVAEAGSLPPEQADLARWEAARIAAQDGEYGQALASLGQIAPTNDLLARLTLPIGKDGAEVTALESARRRVEGLQALEAQLGPKLENPAPPADAPKVRLTTDQGPIVIVLFPDRAPKHVANFLARVDDGTYTNLKFHRVEKGRLVQTGDPNTREGVPATWGQGGAGDKVDTEGKNGLIHVPYAVGMARAGADPKSSGSQFYVTLSRQHGFDEDYTVFGMVLDPQSRATLDKIADAPIEEGSRPKTPPVLLSASRE